MSEECVVNDTLSFTTECRSFTNEIWDTTEENSPSVSEEQEVNKPLVNDFKEQSDFPSLFDELQAANENTNTLNVEPTDITNDNSSIPNEEANGHVQKKLKRNVTFPNDSSIVMGFSEPPNPWKDMPDWRTEDLLRAYTKGCDKHGTKPLNKVLQQLQCIENVGERYEILSLKGERLDLKQIESLEEIFRHVKFRCIDFEATHLDDEMAVAIFEMVEFYESACKVNISFNKNIGPRGWQSCSRLVRNTPCLTFVDARNCDLNERVIPFIGRALRMGCYLTRLHLQNANIAGRALIILVAALKMNETLKELSIGDNKFMPTDGVHIGNLLKYNHKLELLDLRNNHLQDAGTTHIADGLAEQNVDGGLLTLVLWNNQITFQAMRSLNKSLTSCEYIETLNLGHNPVTNEGIHILKDGLLKSRSLLKLGLSGTKVTCEGAVALAEVIADNNRLIRVDLQENDIKTAGLMALSLALKVNENLVRLDLDRDTKKEAGIKDYVDQQKRLQQDISSILERNRDLSRQREEERRHIELKNEENAKNLQEAANEGETTHGEEEVMQYIPTGDSVHRPRLLFLPQTPVLQPQDLDSPAVGSDTFHSSPLIPEHSTLPVSVEGPDLLSPQYCPDPKITVKKIFSVSQVMSPIVPLPVGDYIDGVKHPISNPSSGVPQICTPLPSLALPNSSSEGVITPNTIQKTVEEQTLENYIQDIIGSSNESSVKDSDGQTGKCADDMIKHSLDKTDVQNTPANNGTGSCETHLNETKYEGNLDEGDNKNLKTETVKKSVHGQEGLCGTDMDISVNGKNDSELENSKTSDKGQCNDLPDDMVNSVKNNSGELYNNVNKGILSNEAVVENTSNVNSLNTIDVEGVVHNENIQICDSHTKNIPGPGDIDEASENCDGNVNGNASSCDKVICPDTASGTQPETSESLSVKDYISQLDGMEPLLSDSQSDVRITDVSGQSEIDAFEGVSKFGMEGEMNSLSFDKVNERDGDCKKSILTSGDSAIKNESPNTDSKQQDSSARNSADLESWNSVGEAELSENESLVLVSSPNDKSGTNKPDFFSSLSLNGLKQELASLIDEEGNHSTAGSLVNGAHTTPVFMDADKVMDDLQKSTDSDAKTDE